MVFMLDKQELKPGLVIFRRKDVKHRNWYCRIQLPNGSWNRKPFSGYKVVFVPFDNGKPAGLPVDVLTGFVDADGNAQGRPVGVAIDGRGSLLVADDVGNKVWRVSAR